MQPVSNYAKACAMKQRDESVSIHQPQPTRRYDNVRAVFLDDVHKRLGCRRMPKSLPQVAWALRMCLEQVMSAVRLLQTQNVIEIQKQKRSADRHSSAIERIERCLSSFRYALVPGQDALLPQSFN